MHNLISNIFLKREALIDELIDVQNRLEAFTSVDIVSITGFMKSNEEIQPHIELCKKDLDRYEG